jgi:hypothetical protein
LICRCPTSAIWVWGATVYANFTYDANGNQTSASVAVRIHDINAETVATRYFHTDFLGSVSVITDETGQVLERPVL